MEAMNRLRFAETCLSPLSELDCGAFPLLTGEECVKRRLMCDGFPDCENGADENPKIAKVSWGRPGGPPVGAPAGGLWRRLVAPGGTVTWTADTHTVPLKLMDRVVSGTEVSLAAGHAPLPRDVTVPSQFKPGVVSVQEYDRTTWLARAAKVDRKNIGGVGFLVNSTVHHLVDSYKIISPRVAVLRLETKDQGTISIINGYAPTSAATDEEKEEFYKLFERTVNDEKS
ncbi:unnamed protein product [Heligmosomoides polygyrus]|uniref:Sortilin_C domain-containing protein n=1 Tax=Heligmosomoides polygyrus TaxID=6339 RepID=A0A3P8BCP6_HELPZ|nr:unnamed protein product [Heligmosomoides polygyrus]